jgi:hypothetical protein
VIRLSGFCTVPKEFGLSGGQTVVLLTLVQNPPTANNIVNPTSLDSRPILSSNQNKIGLLVSENEKKVKKKFLTELSLVQNL